MIAGRSQPAQRRIYQNGNIFPGDPIGDPDRDGPHLKDAGITKERVMEIIKEFRGGQRVTDPQAESRYRTLEKYSRDLNRMAQEGKARSGHRA